MGEPTFAALFTALTMDLSMYPVFLNQPSYKGGIPLLLSNNMLVVLHLLARCCPLLIFKGLSCTSAEAKGNSSASAAWRRTILLTACKQRVGKTQRFQFELSETEPLVCAIVNTADSSAETLRRASWEK
jgi:hypothetical protein